MPFLLANCHTGQQNTQQEPPSLLRLLSPERTGVGFSNTIIEDDTFNMVDHMYVYNGGGVAVADINNDGLPDIYFTGNMVPDRLYLNKGNLEFEDITGKSGIENRGWSTGVTSVDINNDGWLDFYVCQSGNNPPGKRKNHLWINNGDLTFSDKAESYGLADESYSTQAAFFDYDKDGDLDLYLLNHTNEVRNPNKVSAIINDGSGPANDRLYRNNGDLTFSDVTKPAGILFDGFGLGIGISDFNNDGWEDVYVSNDFIANDFLYINNQDGTFSESASLYFKHLSQFGMGNDLSDFNNDGLTDVVTLDMLPPDNYHFKKMAGPLNYNLFEYTLEQGYMPQYMRNTLQYNSGATKNGHPVYCEISQLSGIHATDWSWAPLWADLDNDGWKDLLITNGYLRDITDLDFINYTATLSGKLNPDSIDAIIKQKAKEMPSLKVSNFLFQNNRDLTFNDVSTSWGFDEPSLSNGVAYGDLDLDGDLEVVINNINAPAFIYENLANEQLEHHFLQLTLRGDSLNPLAIGATAALYASGQIQLKRVAPSRGYQSSVDIPLHFGLGDVEVVDSIRILWPDGAIQWRYQVKSDQVLIIDKKSTPASPDQTIIPKPTVLTETSQSLVSSYKHVDKFYNDFSRQFLLPHKHSRQGPGIAVGDVNGDGQDDFFVGGGYQYAGRLFLQTGNNSFWIVPLTSDEDKYEEDTGVLFFDADNDHDNDLYVVSGSNEFLPDSEYYCDRLYFNDGHGNFTLASDALPDLRSSGSCVRASDFDQDGDLDLFVGGRLSPLAYPFPGASKLLINEGGKFTDQTDVLAKGLREVGMVTDAIWTDFDNDFDTDLLVVGEFMPVQFFRNNNGKLENITAETGLPQTNGWWNSIAGADFDNDGDTDYIIGNLGLNSKYRASPEQPINVYAADYDQNGFIDPILTYFVDGVEYPVHARDDLLRQVPHFKKKYASYAAYAKADISDVLSKEQMDNALSLKAYQLASCYLENLGQGRFAISRLPVQAQFSTIFGISIRDFNLDGFQDVLITGNNYSTEVLIGRYDASIGLLMIGDGTGKFKPVSPAESGLMVDGDVKGSAVVMTGKELTHIFSRNSEDLKTYRKEGKPVNLIKIPKEALKAKIVLQDGSERIHEFYYGSSYLSQSSRFLELTGEEEQVIIYNFKGDEINLNAMASSQ
ncbi:VCBS repeat-containing protein [Fulvivirgaceae bacterium BMA12]|uniref:VCBS repeat-containing protein n=1 Tax=Agaribacillus aureus TaxID=3051825 RepID=A0ABT8L4N6_9BACT|nr:VCBS repeat-containing protein [Fulvivirgaceae bacterium BMA12]